MKTLCIKINNALHNASVKDVLSGHLFVSDSLISKLKKRYGSVMVNNIPVYTNYHLKTDDILSVIVSDDKKDERIIPLPLPLSIIYEDEDYILLNKPSGISIHPARDPAEITLENALAYYLKDTDDNPHPVSRLDRGTTGIIMIAKSGWAHNLMKISQKNGLFQKEYLAVCVGVPSEKHGFIDAPIGYYPGSTYQRIISEDGLPSLSEYYVLKQNSELSLLRLIPHTGRTHQLRVHMSHIGHPLLGDWLYGTKDSRINRPALHSYQLTYSDQFYLKNHSFCAPLPSDMEQFFGDISECALSFE